MRNELKIARYEAILWELLYKLEAGIWHLEDFSDDTVERLKKLVNLPIWLRRETNRG